MNFEFSPLEISGENYMSWKMHIEIYLRLISLIETLKGMNDSSRTDRTRSMIFLRMYLNEVPENEFLAVAKPSELWNSLKGKFNNRVTL